jgi:hypothetical protein
MEFNFLIDIKFFPKFDENAIYGIEVVTIISTCSGEVENNEIIISACCFERLMILVPFHKEGLLADSSISLDNKGPIILRGGLHIEPFFNHQVIFLQAAS